MSATFIPALVIKHNNSVFLTPDLAVGVTMTIPTPGAGGVIDGDYWAVPISDYGIVTGFNYTVTTPEDTDPPTLQSFHVFRLISRFGNDVWYVRGTTTTDGESPANAGYIQAAQDAECCEADPATLPTDVPLMQPCQTACEWDTDENYFFLISVPTDAGTYTANGYLNGETLSAATGATPTALVSSMNSLWTNQGSPQIAITWTLINDTTIKGVITAGDGADTLCANVTTSA